jgi:hypothetical protein
MFLLGEHVSVQAFILSSIKIYVFASLRHKELLPIGRILNFKRNLVND